MDTTECRHAHTHRLHGVSKPPLADAAAHTLTCSHLPHLLSTDRSCLCLRNQHVAPAHVAMNPGQSLWKDELKVGTGGPASSLGIWPEMTLQAEFARPEVQSTRTLTCQNTMTTTHGAPCPLKPPEDMPRGVPLLGMEAGLQPGWQDVEQGPLSQETRVHSVKDGGEDLGAWSSSGRPVIDGCTGCQAANTPELRCVTYRNGSLIIR